MSRQLVINSVAIGMLVSSMVYAAYDEGSMSINYDSVIDANVIQGKFNSFLPPSLQPVKIRIAGIDTPSLESPKCEKERQLGLQAKALLEKSLSKELPLLIKYSAWDKYGGWIIGKVYQKDVDVGEILIDKGLAVEFSADLKKNWCE
jgi:endonuclease YncB( thermonuclease family)